MTTCQPVQRQEMWRRGEVDGPEGKIGSNRMRKTVWLQSLAPTVTRGCYSELPSDGITGLHTITIIIRIIITTTICRSHPSCANHKIMTPATPPDSESRRNQDASAVLTCVCMQVLLWKRLANVSDQVGVVRAVVCQLWSLNKRLHPLWCKS